MTTDASTDLHGNLLPSAVFYEGRLSVALAFQSNNLMHYFIPTQRKENVKPVTQVPRSLISLVRSFLPAPLARVTFSSCSTTVGLPDRVTAEDSDYPLPVLNRTLLIAYISFNENIYKDKYNVVLRRLTAYRAVWAEDFQQTSNLKINI